MTKSERLLSLLQLLRQYKRPIKAQTLAEELHISTRTVYRDIDTLRLQGAEITGEPGIGYVLKDGFLLPPLMFTIEEIESLILGSRWVSSHADAALKQANEQAMAKIQTVLPEPHKKSITNNTIYTPAFSQPEAHSEHTLVIAQTVRKAIREEYKLTIDYKNADDITSKRTIHPFALVFFDSVQVIAAWCELRHSFRHFRVDRMQSATMLSTHYLPRKRQLLTQWQTQECISIPD